MPDPTAGFAALSTLSGFTVIAGAAMVIALVAGLVIAWTYISSQFTQEDATEIGLAVAVILSGVISVMLFIYMFCSTIHPIERFVGKSLTQTPADTLLAGITDAEQKVCELINRTDKYIESDVGKPGQDDPSLVVAAQRKARVNVPGGQIVVCTADSPAPSLEDAATRLTLLENTLKWFTGPELEASFKKSQAGCESFISYWRPVHPVFEGFADPATVVDIAALQSRLDTVMSEIADQHRQYLDPMDKQTERLNRGEVSDCQKKMGANAGADAAAASTRPPPGTPMSD